MSTTLCLSFLLGAAYAPSASADETKTITRGGVGETKTIKRKGTRTTTTPRKPAATQGDKKKGKKGPRLQGPFEKDQYPLQERLRPLVLPANMFEGGLAVTYLRPEAPNTLTGDLGFAYGIGDVLELGIGSGAAFLPDAAWNKTVTLQGHALVADGKKVDFAPGLVVPIPTASGAPFGIVVDLTSRALLGKKAFLTFGQGALPIAVSPDVGLSIVGNLGLGVQLSKSTALLADTSLISVEVVPDAAVSGIWDKLTLGAALQHSPSRMVDLGLRGSIGHVWQTEGDANGTSGTVGAYAALRL